MNEQQAAALLRVCDQQIETADSSNAAASSGKIVGALCKLAEAHREDASLRWLADRLHAFCAAVRSGAQLHSERETMREMAHSHLMRLRFGLR
jgi:hypothetical protein